jgi:hypothetical protein
MSGYRQDYLLREIARLRELVARALNDRRGGTVDEALRLALDLQVKLFPLPPERFLQLDAAEQFNQLVRGENTEDAAEKIQTYSELLVHAASLYDIKDRADYALGARQLALHLALLGVLELPDPDGVDLVRLVRCLLAGEKLHAPVEELLAEFDRVYPAEV